MRVCLCVRLCVRRYVYPYVRVCVRMVNTFECSKFEVCGVAIDQVWHEKRYKVKTERDLDHLFRQLSKLGGCQGQHEHLKVDGNQRKALQTTKTHLYAESLQTVNAQHWYAKHRAKPQVLEVNANHMCSKLMQQSNSTQDPQTNSKHKQYDILYRTRTNAGMESCLLSARAVTLTVNSRLRLAKQCQYLFPRWSPRPLGPLPNYLPNCFPNLKNIHSWIPFKTFSLILLLDPHQTTLRPTH